MSDSKQPEVSFLDWFDTLPDAEQDQLLQWLQGAAADLGIVLNEKPLIPHDFLEFGTRILANVSLN